MLLLLAILLALIVLHSAVDEALASGLVVCVALAILVVARFLLPPPHARRVVRVWSQRAPPPVFAYAPVAPHFPQGSTPLRL